MELGKLLAEMYKSENRTNDFVENDFKEWIQKKIEHRVDGVIDKGIQDFMDSYEVLKTRIDARQSLIELDPSYLIKELDPIVQLLTKKYVKSGVRKDLIEDMVKNDLSEYLNFYDKLQTELYKNAKETNDFTEVAKYMLKPPIEIFTTMYEKGIELKNDMGE